MKRKKNIERICKNCQLFDPDKRVCSIVILHEGERVRLPVEPEDLCFFENDILNPESNSVENFSSDIQQVKFWVENEKGEKTDKDGVVKMEFPEGFFGETLSKILGK